jgi:hypothetical protein
MSRWTRAGGLAGIAFFLLMIGRVIVSPEAGNPEDPTGVIAAKVAAHAGGVLVNQWAGNVAVLLLLVFAVGLCEHLRRTGADRELVGLACVGAGVTSALALVDHAAWAALAYQHGGVDAGATRTLFDLAQFADAAAWFPIALFAGATSAAALQTGALSRGVAGIGFAVAALALLAGAGLGHSGILQHNGAPTVLALLAFVLWTAIAGGRLARTTTRVPLPMPVPA